jgi:hypothetical protein
MNFLPTIEPDWMKAIPSSSICQYFFVIFALVAGMAALVVVQDILIIVSTRGKKGWGFLLRAMIAFILPVVNALFLYILCSRSLLEKSK